MADVAYVRDYFSRHAELWNQGHYASERLPRVYPIGSQRLRIALEQVAARLGDTQGRRLADFGCGGGELCLHASLLGLDVVGIDIAEGMIEQARKRLAAVPADKPPTGRVRFVVGDVLQSGLPRGAFDAVVALGLLEYLPADAPFFSEAFSVLRPGGVLVLSGRNRLFNLASLNRYTSEEIERGSTGELLEGLKWPGIEAVSSDALREFASRLSAAASELSEALESDLRESEPLEDARPAAFGQTRRQHIPEQLAGTARAAGFDAPAFTGVHPQPLPPELHRHAPRFYNRLALAYEALEATPLSLRWSSAFIAAFTKPC